MQYDISTDVRIEWLRCFVLSQVCYQSLDDMSKKSRSDNGRLFLQHAHIASNSKASKNKNGDTSSLVLCQRLPDLSVPKLAFLKQLPCAAAHLHAW
jgi:hypothetical protein